MSSISNYFRSGSQEEIKPILEHNEDIEIGPQIDEDEIFVEANQIDGNYFNDGKTVIDFVLVYEDIHKKKKKIARHLSVEETYRQKQKKTLQEQHKKFRKKFLKQLKEKGIEIEMEQTVGQEKTIYYYKLNCNWENLIYYAEELNLRAPLQLRQYKSHHWSGKILDKLKMKNIMSIAVPNQPKLYFTCTFRKNKLSHFLGSHDHANYFSTTDRHRIMWEILERTLYGKKKKAEIGIERLLNENVFSAAFALHDGHYKTKKPISKLNVEELNRRQVLYEYWARWGRWYKYQPLDHIRDYFGEKIGIYFAWLGFYTAWLLPVAFLGLFLFLVSAMRINTNIPAVELCNSGHNFTMCPVCGTCEPWFLSQTCLLAKLSFLFDNTSTVIFATLMSFWAVFFLEFWKRKSSGIAHHWEVMDFIEEEERPRPEFSARCPTMTSNPITGILEPHFPSDMRVRRSLTGVAILCIMLFVVIIFVVSVIIYKCIITIVIHKSANKVIQGEASFLTTLTAAVFNLILIMLMANVYTKVAEWLTKWEMHRTQTEYENALTLKVFVFQFVNFYSSIFYIAFFKGKFVGYPGHYLHTLGVRNESCGSGGCLIELAQQLFVIMVGKQAINNLQELVIPKCRQMWQRYKVKKSFGKEKRKNLEKPWEKDYHKMIHYPGLFDEYLEMVLQFGFITIFVAAFPLAPLFALLNNWIEIRLDALKLVCETRRPVTDRAQNIGIWYSILDGLVQVAVITNGFLIAFTSDFIPRLFYKYRVSHDGTLKGYTNFTLAYAPVQTNLNECRYRGYRDREGHYSMDFYELMVYKLAFVIVFEHVVFFIGRMIDWCVPDVPETLQMKIKREHYLAKQALADNRDTTEEVMKLYNRQMSLGKPIVNNQLSQGYNNSTQTTPKPSLLKVPKDDEMLVVTFGDPLSPKTPDSMAFGSLSPNTDVEKPSKFSIFDPSSSHDRPTSPHASYIDQINQTSPEQPTINMFLQPSPKTVPKAPPSPLRQFVPEISDHSNYSSPDIRSRVRIQVDTSDDNMSPARRRHLAKRKTRKKSRSGRN